MSERELTGMHITGFERRNASDAGNPRFSVAFRGRDGEPEVYETQTNASVNWDVENLAGEHHRHPGATVRVVLSRAGRIIYLHRER